MSSLQFGTSGLRGLVVDMTDYEMIVYTAGFCAWLCERFPDATKEIAVGHDLRLVTPEGLESSPRITRAVMRAARASGFEPLFAAAIATPGLAAFAQSRGCAAVMVTGSHIPADRNGLKFYGPLGEISKADEQAIVAAVERARVEWSAERASELVDEAARVVPAGDFYRSRCRPPDGEQPLHGLRVAVFQHTAVGRDFLVEVLTDWGAEAIALGRSDEFVPIDTEDLGAQREAELAALAASVQADALVSTDGDGDRPLILDDSGRFHRGDVVGLVTAQLLAAQTVVVPITASDAVEIWAEANGVRCIRSRVGSPFVIAALREHAQGVSLGWESNGGVLTASEITLAGRTWPALCTRDAMLPILSVLYAAKTRGITVSQLFANLPQRGTAAGLRDGIASAASNEFLRIVIAGTETVARMRLDSMLAAIWGADRKVASWDTIDGLRVRADDGSTLHFRASGNAPQFRVYAQADRAEDARAWVDLCVRDGGAIQKWLQRLV